MNKREREYVQATVDAEGMDYAFVYYTEFTDVVKDEEFHRLRLAYLAARKALVDYAEIGDA